ncbi:MAG: hypothetical protein ACI9CE_001282 [Flavobacterium sp.]|jgi:hypothetical protein
MKTPAILGAVVVVTVLIALNCYTTVPAGHNKVAALFGDVTLEHTW